MPYLSHQQLPAGILPMVPEVAQAVGVSQGHHTKDFTRVAPNPAKATVTAMIARELLYGGTSPTAETILKSNISSGHVPHGPRTRPSEQLYYLSRAQGFQVTVCFPVSHPWASDDDLHSVLQDRFFMHRVACVQDLGFCPHNYRNQKRRDYMHCLQFECTVQGEREGSKTKLTI